jgi:hypothetical protein
MTEEERKAHAEFVMATLKKVAAKDKNYERYVGKVPASSVTVVRSLPCVELGRLVRRVGCGCRREDVRWCMLLKKSVIQATDCETCNHYVADG